MNTDQLITGLIEIESKRIPMECIIDMIPEIVDRLETLNKIIDCLGAEFKENKPSIKLLTDKSHVA